METCNFRTEEDYQCGLTNREIVPQLWKQMFEERFRGKVTVYNKASNIDQVRIFFILI